MPTRYHVTLPAYRKRRVRRGSSDRALDVDGFFLLSSAGAKIKSSGGGVGIRVVEDVEWRLIGLEHELEGVTIPFIDNLDGEHVRSARPEEPDGDAVLLANCEFCPEVVECEFSGHRGSFPARAALR